MRAKQFGAFPARAENTKNRSPLAQVQCMSARAGTERLLEHHVKSTARSTKSIAAGRNNSATAPAITTTRLPGLRAMYNTNVAGSKRPHSVKTSTSTKAMSATMLLYIRSSHTKRGVPVGRAHSGCESLINLELVSGYSHC